MTLQSHSACKQNTQPSCRESPIFSWVDLKNSPELTIHVMPYKRTEASRTCTISMPPLPKLKRNELYVKRRSFTTWKT